LLLDGKKLAAELYDEMIVRAQALEQSVGRPPRLDVILVGADPASKVYVGHKERVCKKIGINSHIHSLAADVSQEQAQEKLLELAEDQGVDGILLQLPVPKHLDALQLLDCIPPEKDVDGLSTLSQGRLAKQEPGLRPCTPKGILELLERNNIEVTGKRVCVLGRSLLVGASVARMLEHKKATVITFDSAEKAPKEVSKLADIVIVATGCKHLVDASWLKPGAVIVDVGIHRTPEGLCGDVNFDSVSQVVSAITPVPGGIGPMTVAMLMDNCLQAFEGRNA
jgi:methylenetetrahydrofolate dehydrogenase (NADP+)/methenyltetrahydrofolate cyclohydrolase